MAVAPSPHGVSPSGVNDVDTRLSRLERELQVLTERVQRLDALAEAGGLAGAGAGGADVLWMQPRTRGGASRVITHIGRALIALGVGYLLRAVVDAGLIAQHIGVWIGLAYAVGWLGVCFKSRQRGDRLGAAFAGALAPLLAFPLISEAALRFHVWPAAASFGVLAIVTAAAIVTGALNRLQSVAWVAALGGAITAATLMVGLRAYAAGEVFFIALGIGTLWLGYVRDWTLLRWPAALLADVMAVGLVLRALDPDTGQSPYAAMAVLLLLMASYPLSIIVRTVVLNRDVVLFEIVQCVALLLLLRGALALSPLIGSARTLLGAAVLGLGVAVSATAVAFARRHEERTLNAHFYATVGTVLLMVGGAILLQGVWLALFWMLGASALIVVALRPGRGTFMAHAAVLAIASAWPSDLFAYATRALVGAGATLGAPPAVAVAACALLAAVAWMAMAPTDPRSEILRRTAALIVSAALLWTAAGLAAGAGILAATSVLGAATASAVATIRTLTLSCVASLAAGAGRVPRVAIAGWLSYPILLFIALKLVAEDLRAGTPLALFVALAVYGAALIISARLR